MLVITRKLGEKVYISDDIMLVVVAVNGRSIRFGIEAPADVPILREELLHERRTPGGDGHAAIIQGVEAGGGSKRRQKTDSPRSSA